MKILPDFEERQEIVDGLANIADGLEGMNIRCVKPMIGGVFGFQRFWMSSALSNSDGLHEVTYFVIEKSSGVPFGIGKTKDMALGMAREFVSRTAVYFDSLTLQVIAERERRQAENLRQAKEAARVNVIDIKSERAQEKRIPRRRLEVFNKSNGQCHYCACQLDLYGKWHVEHMMPKALNGGDEPGNLVASCVTCNHKKKDKTAEEFIALRAKLGAIA